MLHMYVPVDKSIANVGQAYEKAILDAADFLAISQNKSDALTRLTYDVLLQSIEARLKELKPYMNQWMIARHGMSLN